MTRSLQFEVVKGETDHILLSGKQIRRPTVLILVGDLSVSRKALLLGIALTCCQILDLALTYAGLSLLGTHMEGNSILRKMMYIYGMTPTLMVAKLIAIGGAVGLTIFAHRRRWARPFILGLIVLYVGLAVVPWILKLLAIPSGY